MNVSRPGCSHYVIAFTLQSSIQSIHLWGSLLFVNTCTVLSGERERERIHGVVGLENSPRRGLPRTEREVEVEAAKVSGVCEFPLNTVTVAMHAILPLSVLLSWFIVSILVALPSSVAPFTLYFPLPVLPIGLTFAPLCVHERVSLGPPWAVQENVTSLPPLFASITSTLGCRGVWIVGLSEKKVTYYHNVIITRQHWKLYIGDKFEYVKYSFATQAVT